jgi:hypothetical protein
MTVQATALDYDLFNEDLVQSYVSNQRFLRRDWLLIAAGTTRKTCVEDSIITPRSTGSAVDNHTTS